MFICYVVMLDWLFCRVWLMPCCVVLFWLACLCDFGVYLLFYFICFFVGFGVF